MGVEMSVMKIIEIFNADDFIFIIVIQNEEKGNVNIAYDPDSEGKNASETRTINPDDPKQKRDNWDNPIEFLFSCISMSVGLGNIWRERNQT